MKLLPQNPLTPAEFSEANEIIVRNLASHNGYRMQRLTEDDIEYIDWSADEKEFIEKHGDNELYILYDCTFWETGQMLSIVAVY